MTNFWLAMLAVATVLATPGPTNTLLATGGALRGLRNALPLVTAELLGYLVTVDLVGFVLRPVIVAAPWIGIAIKLILAAYLAYAAVKLWRRPRAEAGGQPAVTWQGVFVATMLNPKGLIFALVILPFGSPELPSFLLALAVLVLAIGCCWVCAGSVVGRLAGDCRRFVPRVASVALAGFAAVIAATAFG